MAGRPEARALAFDFPQDYPIRLLLDGGVVPFDQHVTHDICLRQGITLIEYLVNTAAITAPRVFFSAAPLKIPGQMGLHRGFMPSRACRDSRN